MTGSTSADTLIVDVSAGQFVDPVAGGLWPITANLAAGADAISLRLGDDDNVVTGGSLGADLDGDAAPDLIYNATERLIVTGGTGADDFEFGGDGAGLGGPLVFPATLNGGAGDDTLRGGALGDTFSAARARTSSPTTTASRP